MKLATCLLNVSEARNSQVIKDIVKAAVKSIESVHPIGATVLNAFIDKEYNRSVITISGRLAPLEDAVVAASTVAMETIDMRLHTGGHPRLGSVDLIPVHPITEVPGSSFFMFGEHSGHGTLIERRRQYGWFKSNIIQGVAPDIGSFEERYGLTGAGACPYMSNFNISLDTEDMKVAKKVLERIRSKSGGFPGVSAMAFHHTSGIEIACNVDMFRYDETHSKHLQTGSIQRVYREFWRTRFDKIQSEIMSSAAEDNVSTIGDSVIIGFTPLHAYDLTLDALKNENSCLVNFVKNNHHM